MLFYIDFRGLLGIKLYMKLETKRVWLIHKSEPLSVLVLNKVCGCAHTSSGNVTYSSSYLSLYCVISTLRFVDLEPNYFICLLCFLRRNI